MSWIGVAALLGALLSAFCAGRVAGHRTSSKCRHSAVLLGALVTSVWLRYNPTVEASLFSPHWYAYVRPWWSIVLGMAFLGSAVPQLPERRKRRAVDGFALFLLLLVAQRTITAAGTSSDELTGSPHAQWGTCKQTTGFSCGAAAASTLLWQHGIRTTEAEMARRCLTNGFLGTDEIGVLKGLAEKVAGRPWTVELEAIPADKLESTLLPAMASTKLSPLMGHWIVILECSDEKVRIADPLYADDVHTGGIRELALEEFAAEYGGVLVRIRMAA